MAENTAVKDDLSEKVALTLQLDAKVYEAFLRKARQAGLEIEPFLSNTLTIVLGCRVFNEKHSCSSVAQDGVAKSS